MEKLFIIFCWVLSCTTVYGQSNGFRNYTIYDGLVQMKPFCLFEDSNSFLWIGTRNGVSKYDGKEFTSFRKDDGLPHSVVLNIVEDNKGNILIGDKKWDCKIRWGKNDTL